MQSINLWTGLRFAYRRESVFGMKVFIALILWFLLFAISWPLALVLLFLFPLIWLIALPFRIVGFTLEVVFKLIGSILMFPFRVAKSL